MPVNNQNPQQQKRVPVSINGYPQAVHDMMRAKYPDYDQVMGLGNQTMQGGPSGQIPAVAPQPMNVNVFQQNGGVSGKLEAPAVQTQQADLTPSTPAPAPEYGTDGVQFTNPAQTQQNDLSALSSALNGSDAQQRQVPEFQADPSQRDGGFFGWLGKLIPKSRPGMREGETPDEYDRRITTNRERIAAFGDAIRHMGNIVNTSKGAPLQVFNDPTTMMEEAYQKRKTKREKQAALDADAAYKQANLDLKSAAARADQAYKLYLAGLRGDNAQLAKDKFEYRKGKDAAATKYKQEKDQRDFEYKQGRDRAKDEQTNRRLNISQYNATHKGSGRGRSGGGGGSSAKYVTWDAEGKPHYASNKTMYEANEAYYNGNTSGNSSTSSSKEVFNKDGSTTRTTNRQGGSSVAQRAGAQRRQREEARKKAAKPAGKSKNGYKNTKKLGL
ncbi:hypothetical protein DW657_13355 [Prevotella sp. AM23-5]|uniref:hypothetical protein n=1 Tax=Prevotellaceae TaxID=171552 RepID=UPI000E53E5DA|nr:MULTISPECIES: hypothetical protein [Prevotellaceae]RHN89484.1 hypothetical protein DW657_13355 [Prevotella sp. AM23-5]